MISTNLYAVTCVVHEGHAGSGRRGWAAKICWQDDRFCQPQTVEGVIKTRYYEESLALAIDTVVEVAKRFGLPLGSAGGPIALLYKGDGEDPNYPPPGGWDACKRLLIDEAKRRGWCSYAESEVSQT